MLCEGPAQNLGQVSDRNDDLNRVAMHEDEPGIRINRLDVAERKNMVRALQRPTTRAAGTVLKMLQEALVETKSVELPIGIEPLPITRDGIGRVEARTAKDMRGYLRTFLRRFGSDGMHLPELRGQKPEHAELASDPLTLTGIALCVAGLCFKASVAPFHQWTPDVYEGAPTPVTAFMAVATKVAALGVLLRFFDVALIDAQASWGPALAVLATITNLRLVSFDEIK